MNIHTFRRNEAAIGNIQNPFGYESKRRTICFRGKQIAISELLRQQLEVNRGSHIAFAYDEDHPERMYVRPADYPDDSPQERSLLSLMRKDKAMLACYNVAVVRHALEHTGAQKSCTCYVSQKPININGKDHYQVLLSCPLRIN